MPQNSRALVAFVALMLLDIPLAQCADAFRTWTEATGRFRTEAQFLDLNDGRVLLRKKDRNFVVVPVARLSAADQAYAKMAADAAMLDPRFRSRPNADAALFLTYVLHNIQLAWPDGPEFFEAQAALLRENRINSSAEELWAEWLVETKSRVTRLREHIAGTGIGGPELLALYDLCLERIDALEKHMVKLGIISADATAKAGGAFLAVPVEAGIQSVVAGALGRGSSSPYEMIFNLGIAAIEALDANYERQKAETVARTELERLYQLTLEKSDVHLAKLSSTRGWNLSFSFTSFPEGDLEDLFLKHQFDNPILGAEHFRRAPPKSREENVVAANTILNLIQSVPEGEFYEPWLKPLIPQLIEYRANILSDKLVQPKISSLPCYSNGPVEGAAMMCNWSKAALSLFGDDKEFRCNVGIQYGRVLGCAGRFSEAAEQYSLVEKVSPSLESHGSFQFKFARYLALSGKTKESFAKVENLLKSGQATVQMCKVDPDLANVRRSMRKEFDELVQIRVKYSINLGFFSDSVTITNQSKFPITNAKLDLSLKTKVATAEEPITFDRQTMYIDVGDVEPGESVERTLTQRVQNRDLVDRSHAMILSDQGDASGLE